jgi:histidinol-phosphate phosphatase family protein
MSRATRAVFLDRDGTINVDTGYLRRPGDLRLLEDAAEGLRLLAPHYRLILVSNQSGIGRGLFTQVEADAVHERLVEELAVEGVVLDRALYCPHHPDEACSCRKPRPGLLRQAARAFGLELSRCWIVGDRWSDIAAGAAAGTRTILLPAGSPSEGPAPEPDARAASLLEAARIILGRDGLTASAAAR